MRWIMLAVSVLGFVISFGTQSVGILVLGLLLALGGMVGAVFAFAAARVESVSQGQSSRELSILLDAKKLNVAPAAGAKPAQAQARPPARREQQRAERGVEIDFPVGAYSTAGSKSGHRSAHDHDRSDAASDSGGGDGGSGGD